MADRKAITDGTMSALGLATAAAIVFFAPTGETSFAAQGENGLVEASGSWTQMEQGDPATSDQQADRKADIVPLRVLPPSTRNASIASPPCWIVAILGLFAEQMPQSIIQRW